MITATVWLKDLLTKFKKSTLSSITNYFLPPPTKTASDIAMAIPIMGCIISFASLIASICLSIGVFKGNPKMYITLIYR